MLSSQIDYVIASDIMGFKPKRTAFMNPKGEMVEKNNRTIWTNEENENFHFYPSNSTEHSRLVIKRMINLGFEFRMYSDGDRWICSFSKKESHHGISKNDNQAICYAAIQAFVNES